MNTTTLIIDGIEIETHAGETLLTAAAKAEIYIPTLCAHPDLPPGCGIEDSPAIYRGHERQLIQQYLQKHGHLPEGNDELADLF